MALGAAGLFCTEGGAMQAGMHSSLAVLARATSNPDQNRPCKPNTVVGSSCGVRGQSKILNAANQEITAAQCQLKILTHLVGSRAEQVDVQRDSHLNHRTSEPGTRPIHSLSLSLLAYNSSHYQAARHKGRVRRETRRWGPPTAVCNAGDAHQPRTGWGEPGLPTIPCASAADTPRTPIHR